MHGVSDHVVPTLLICGVASFIIMLLLVPSRSTMVRKSLKYMGCVCGTCGRGDVLCLSESQ
jgi:hypothetical protein